MRQGAALREIPPEVYAHQALSTPTRLRALNLLLKEGPQNIEEISEKVGLKEITVRHHIRMLEHAGLIESFESTRSTLGRPMRYFKIADKPPNLTFPKRQYEMLTRILLENMISKAGRANVVQDMQTVGKHIATEFMNDLRVRYAIQEWNLDNFRNFAVPELDRLGSYPTIVKASNDEIVLKISNCIFSEVAKQFKGILCEAHKAFFQTIVNYLGDFAVRQDTCMADGDESCVTTMIRAKSKARES